MYHVDFRLLVGSKMIYLKELGRSIPTGLLIGAESRPKISIDKDLSTAQINYKHLMDESVDRMEVRNFIRFFFFLLNHQTSDLNGQIRRVDNF